MVGQPTLTLTLTFTLILTLGSSLADSPARWPNQSERAASPAATSGISASSASSAQVARFSLCETAAVDVTAGEDDVTRREDDVKASGAAAEVATSKCSGETSGEWGCGEWG